MPQFVHETAKLVLVLFPDESLELNQLIGIDLLLVEHLFCDLQKHLHLLRLLVGLEAVLELD